MSGANSGGLGGGGVGGGGANSGGVSGAFAGTPSAGGSDGGATASLGGASGAGGASATAGSAATACPTLPAMPIPVNGIIQFNDNGGWNWFQDERAVVDRAKNKFVIGSVASGGARDGNIEAVVYDAAAGTKQLFTLGTGLKAYPDDHNAPAFLVRPDGKYFAIWAGHRLDCNSRSSIFDGTAWSVEALFDWSSFGCPWAGSDSNRVTYANPWYLGGSIFAAVRSVDTTPALLTSGNDGATLAYYGRLVATPQVGNVAGYYKYWGNNSDRIDFVGTDGHPRDFDASLWHGYLKGGKLYDTKDMVVDDNAGDNDAQALKHFTQAVATGVTLGGVMLSHLWNHDIVRYPDGTIAILGQGRVAGSGFDDPDLRLIYARYDGSAWRSSYLAKAGHKLFVDEQDYTGLSALHPENPNIIFISTNVDPRDDSTPLAKHEIFEGVTCDEGATWRWAPLTRGSAVDNLRPIVPKWDASHTLLLWLSGTYVTAQHYSLAVVGTMTLL
ncbi:MAG: hypothetical protein WDO74_32945 [Pseudomonadota bacterium]